MAFFFEWVFVLKFDPFGDTTFRLTFSPLIQGIKTELIITQIYWELAGALNVIIKGL